VVLLELIEYPIVAEVDFGLANLDILLYSRVILKNLALVVASIKYFVLIFIENCRVEKLVH